MAFSLDEIKKFSQTPASIPAPGRYGEGQVVYISQMLDTLKSAVKDGSLSLVEFQGLVPTLAKQAQRTAVNAGGRGGSGSTWQSIVDAGFADGNGKMTNPFTNQEYAQLPTKVLPTQQDINTGMFDTHQAPVQRIAPPTPTTPQVNPGVDGSTPIVPAVPTQTPDQAATNTTPGVSTPNAQTGDAPVFTANPNNPSPYGGLQSTNSQASLDAQKIADEAALQQQLSVQAANERAGKRKGYLNDLSSLITQQNNQTLTENLPGLQEKLNSQGLLRSSELGNQIATQQKSLAQTSANALGQAGLQAEQQDLGDYKSIQDLYNQSRNEALSRQFSVEDYNNQIAAGKALGDQYASLKPNAVKGGKGQAVGTVVGGVGGAYLGGAPGAMAGSQIGGAAGQGKG